MLETVKKKGEIESIDLSFCPEKIVAVSNGFVYVGHVMGEEGWLRISDAYNIRRWGTSKGLGQLAIDGKQKETILDFCGIVRVPMHAILFMIDSTAGLLP